MTSEPGLPEAPFFAQSLAVPAPPPAPVDELPAAAPLVRVKPAPESQAASRHLESLIGAIDDEISAEVQASQTVSAPRPASDSNAQRYVVFHLGNTRYGLAIGEVLEMAIVPRTTPLPNVPGFVRGVANLRGEVLAVIDLRTFLSLEASPDTVRERLLVVRSPHGDAVAGLIVDSVRGLARLGHGAVVQPSLPLETRVADFLQGVSSHDDQVLNILDTRKLFTAPEIARLSAN